MQDAEEEIYKIIHASPRLCRTSGQPRAKRRI